MTRPPALAIVGPTASGKTALSLLVAERLDGEIISMDSRQVYRGMEIGTAKATPEQRARAPHHGLDLVDPSHRFSAGQFGRLARRWIADISARGHVPVLVGGTGFFLRSLTHPIFREPPLDEGRRRALQRYLEAFEDERLHRWLAVLDPPGAARLRAWGGRQRLLRALEVPLLTGHPLSWWHRTSPPEALALEPLTFVLDLPRELLFARIDARVDEMAAAGLLDEVAALLRAGYGPDAPGMNATGYAELLPVLRGERPLHVGLELVKRNTRAYAKRQLTWFRGKLPRNARWLDAARPLPELADEIAARWSEATRAVPHAAPTDDRGPMAEGAT